MSVTAIFRQLDGIERLCYFLKPASHLQAAGGPFKPDFGLSAAVRRLDQVFRRSVVFCDVTLTSNSKYKKLTM